MPWYAISVEQKMQKNKGIKLLLSGFLICAAA